MFKKIEKYFKSHPFYNSSVHLIGGMGLGIFITYPLVGEHPLRWAIVLLSVGILAHLYPLAIKDKR